MYLDTSVVVKLLVREPDSDFYQDALQGQLIASSELAVTEVWSALLSKERLGAIDDRQRRRAWQVFLDQVSSKQLWLYAMDSVQLRKANLIMEQCHPGVPLRTLDALHLAACDLHQDFPICTADGRMRDAARKLCIPWV
jgi:predicted nucleic acid-binding protein